MTEHTCQRCGVLLCSDEISLTKKLICREAEQFYCLNCMAEDYGSTREKLQAIIDYFHETGTCLLFAKKEKSP